MEVFILFSYLKNSNKKEVEINITKVTKNHVLRIMIYVSFKNIQVGF